MPEINRASDSCNMIWKLVDRDTGQGERGDRLGVHGRRPGQDPPRERHGPGPPDAPPVPHPRRRPVPRARSRRRTRPNLVWKDTVLVRSDETVDILLDVTNPGLWMAHCHIAEHNQSGMMFSFPVTEAASAQATTVGQADTP